MDYWQEYGEWLIEQGRENEILATLKASIELWDDYDEDMNEGYGSNGGVSDGSIGDYLEKEKDKWLCP